MNTEINNIIKGLLESFKQGKISQQNVISRIKDIYFEDIGYAKVDHHRSMRRNFPEVIFGQNKTDQQVIGIAKKILNYSKLLLVTRTNEKVFGKLKDFNHNIEFNREAKIIYTPLEEGAKLRKGISVICAGTADIPVAEEAAITSYLMGNNVKKIYDVGVSGIHRLLNFKEELKNSNIIITVAGMEGALPSVVSAMVSCPVIGVPTSVGYGSSLGGFSALLTMLNACSPGITVVNIDNGFGAGYTAGIINLKIHGGN
ncbi:MAG: nickel pincer cofactor biosynthesis protein LarB [Candidatus Humimicrobiaceae bacterium]